MAELRLLGLMGKWWPSSRPVATAEEGRLNISPK
jgi:hypothetical protein